MHNFSADPQLKTMMERGRAERATAVKAMFGGLFRRPRQK